MKTSLRQVLDNLEIFIQIDLKVCEKLLEFISEISIREERSLNVDES